MNTPLALHNGERIETTLAHFFALNGFDEAEREEIMSALETNGEYEVPNGASIAWSLRIIDRYTKEPTK